MLINPDPPDTPSAHRNRRICRHIAGTAHQLRHFPVLLIFFMSLKLFVISARSALSTYLFRFPDSLRVQKRRHRYHSAVIVSTIDISRIRFAGPWTAATAARITAARITARAPAGKYQGVPHLPVIRIS